jgi:serine/threonine protein kinase/tetratricopeptide (TPR) repeat protein
MVTSRAVEALRERFGKYHVLDKIAQGGMAEVYKVKTVGIAGFEKIQALKRILPHSAREGRFIRSFIDEARIAVELTHRNIVQVFDFGKADGELFMAMELIEGRDLRTAMTQTMACQAPCPIPIAAYVIGEVAAGLDYAHRKTDGYGGALGIVHCDVSPSNVMLSSEGYVKILDFGVARATFASALERRRLRGKPRYMAPEQTLGEPPTAQADVFALGIIAWELFTGVPLYRGQDVRAILEAVRRTDPARVDRINADVPPEIVDAIATALSREPSARGTAADLAVACTRTALAAGARQLASWLRQLDDTAGAASRSASWSRAAAREPTESIVAALPSSASIHSIGTPPLRPSTRVIVAAAPRDVGEGTAFPVDLPLRERTATISGVIEAHPSRTTEAPYSGFVEHDPTTSVTAGPWVAAVTEVAPPPDMVVQTEAMPALADDEPLTTRKYDALGGDRTSDVALKLESSADVAGEPAIDEPIDDDLGALATAAQAERRRCVVVAAQLDGASLDALRPLTKSLGELAYQRGGVVLSQQDDALVIAFGLEVAGEDDVAVAMGWALDAAALTRDAEHAGGSPALRIGARTGVATAPARASMPSPGDTIAGIPGDAIDEARSLAREALAERPLFVGAAGRVTSSLYALREVSALKRVGRRGRVIEVLGRRGFDERDRAPLERRGKLAGRTQQLAELQTWFERAIAADRRLTASISGAAGTGKSRLIAELIARRTAIDPATRVVMTGANPATHHAPFSLVIDLYQAALGLPPARGRHARAQVVQRLLHLMKEAGVFEDRARAVALDLDRAMELRDGVGVAEPEVADLRPRISAGLAAFRAAMIDRSRPLLTVIEDIHLSDAPSLEVLRHTLAATAMGPELLVLTARPEGPTPPAVDVVLPVGDLVGGELRALIADRLGEAATPLNIAAVIARAGGNPLFVEELAQAVREAGDDVPATARDVIVARVDRLTPRAKAALRLAAVLGTTVRARLLEELMDEEVLEAELDELVEAGFLVRAESAAHSSEGELHFARGLVREVIYEALSARAQRESHARVGRLLSSRFFAGRDEPPAVIAEHLERGGELAAAAAFWLRAGRLALAAFDAGSAVAHFTRTLLLEAELATANGATTDEPPTPTSRARRREALVGREEAHRMLGDVESNPGDLDELERLCAGDASRLADVAIRRAHRLLRLADYAGASAATVLAEDHAIAARDQRLRGEALRLRGEVLERLGRFDEALVIVGDAGELFARIGAISDEMAATVGSGRIHLMRAHYEAARAAYRPVIARIDQTGDPWLERIVQRDVATIERCLGDFTGAMTTIQRSLELCRRYGDRSREGDALGVAGIILLEVGLYDQAALHFRAALDLLSRTASRWSHADCLIYAGVCDVARGDGDGIAWLDEALAEARRLGARYLEASALISRAGAHLRRGQLAAAIHDAQTGTAVASATTLVGYEIQGLARHALALVLDPARGRIDEAVAAADRALALLDEQCYLEGSEEEVFASCYEVLRAAGAGERAAAVKARGRAEVERKLAGLADPSWRAAYSSIAVNKRLLG